ncbi:MAG: type II toxin-antitoxin system VapC family toxin [Microgenomates group bacterium]
MKKYLLETSVIINFFRGKKEAIETLGKLEGEITSSFVCLAELYEGIFRVKERNAVEKEILDFFSSLSEVYGIDRKIAKAFGKIRKELKEKGKVIEDLDILLGATCLAHNLVLVTSNLAHFRRIPGLKIF